jgi:methylglutaconyl-CoA hydratase
MIPLSAHSLIGPDIVRKTAEGIAEIRATPEAQEGLGAFLEKRKPKWTEAPAKKGGTKSGKKAARR